MLRWERVEGSGRGERGRQSWADQSRRSKSRRQSWALSHLGSHLSHRPAPSSWRPVRAKGPHWAAAHLVSDPPPLWTLKQKHGVRPVRANQVASESGSSYIRPKNHSLDSWCQVGMEGLTFLELYCNDFFGCPQMAYLPWWLFCTGSLVHCNGFRAFQTKPTWPTFLTLPLTVHFIILKKKWQLQSNRDKKKTIWTNTLPYGPFIHEILSLPS